MRRVVVTGLGLVTPLGSGVEPVWRRLVDGRSGLRAVQGFDVSELPSKVAGQVPYGDAAEGGFNPDDYVTPRERRRLDRFIVYALAAAVQAVEDADWQPSDEESQDRTGVMIGSGIGGLETIAEGALTVKERGPRRLSPYFIPASLVNLASGHVSIRYGFRGPNHAVVTACSTGAHAIGDAARLIILADADVMVAGGAEAAVCRLGLAGFAASRALSVRFNDTPEKASRPWDRSALLTDVVDRDRELLKLHRVHYYHHLLSALGTPPRPRAPRLSVPKDARDWAAERLPDGGPLVAINPGATYGLAKQWFPERFARVARRLIRAYGAKLVFVGGPSEVDVADKVLGLTGEGTNLSGRTDVMQLAAVIRASRILLTNDTGPMHVADAVGTPIVAVFGPTDSVTTPPFSKRYTIVRKEMDCSPCLKRECPLGHHNCMKKVQPDEVFEACGEWLDR